MKRIISGNEAVAIGAFKGGARIASGYPGTPSSEILEFFKNFDDVKARWASNEKSGFEMIYGASLSGIRGFVTMKHVGLNVAADPFMTSAYTGINAGFVVVSADDPSMHSSQNEQDNRFYGKFAKIPVIEPSNPAEAIGYMQYAFIVSEKFDTPVLYRLTTRISHSLGVVEYSNKVHSSEKLAIAKDFKKYVMIPANAIERRKIMLKRFDDLKRFSEETALNKIEKGRLSVGIITSGVSYNYAKEIMPDAHFFKIGLSYPVPIESIRKFIADLDKVIVIEELEPFIEDELKINEIKVEGKRFFPANGELNLDKIENGLIKAGFIKEKKNIYFNDFTLPKRPPVLCPGCPHRPIFDILHSLKVFVTGDIGCYTLGALPPLSTMHTTLCMGASISMGIGVSEVENKEKVVAVIGDSTFFHTGMQPLIDAHLANANLTIIVLDNRITAMTGGQPDASSGFDIKGNIFTPIRISKIAKTIGIEHVFEVDQYDFKNTKKIIEKETKHKGLSVIVAMRECVLAPKKIKNIPFTVTDKCIGCRRCLRIACPAIDFFDNVAIIDESMCTGCAICKEVCPVDGAIVLSNRG